jgi:flagellar basal body-associated protein FliL
MTLTQLNTAHFCAIKIKIIMNKPFLGLVLLVIFIVAGFLLYKMQFSSQQQAAMNDSSVTTKLAGAAEGRSNAGTDTVQDEIAFVAWGELAKQSVPAEWQETNNANIYYIQLGDLTSLTTGDRISIAIPQENTNYLVAIDKVSTSVSGNRSLMGQIEGDWPNLYKILITVGKNQTFATLNTPKGRYQMEARGSIGKIISAVAIDANLDFTKPDYRIPAVSN